MSGSKVGSRTHTHNYCDFPPGPRKGFESAALGDGVVVTGKGEGA